MHFFCKLIYNKVCAHKDLSIQAEFHNNEKSAVCPAKNISNIHICYTTYSQLVPLLLFLLKTRDFSQSPDEPLQGLGLMVLPLQQLIAETGDVLFNIFQLTFGKRKQRHMMFL